MKSVILVTAIGTATSSAIISQLRNSGDYYIIGGDIYLRNQVATAKDVDEFYTFPPAIHDLEGYIEFVIDFCKKHRIEYYFASIDEEVVNLSVHRKRFEEIGVKLCIPNDELIRICHYKDKFSEWINSNIPEIEIKRYKRFDEVDTYPVFIKPVEGRASIGCRKIENKKEADELLCKGIKEEEYLIQEFSDGEIITVDLVRNARTRQKQQIQRIEYLRNANGCGLAVEIVDIPILRDICDELMERLELNGVVNAEFFHKENSFKIIEINPRFSAGTSFSYLAGCDVVADAIRIANDEACEFGIPAIGAHLAKRYETYRLD